MKDENSIPVFEFSDPANPEIVREELGSMLRSIQGSSRIRNDRERPYDGQPQTDQGARGATPVEGLTFRDVVDCFVKGFLLSTGPGELYEKVENDTWVHDDLYKIDQNGIDPGAVAQNMACEMEKMMGIYPNVPGLAVHVD